MSWSQSQRQSVWLKHKWPLKTDASWDITPKQFNWDQCVCVGGGVLPVLDTASVPHHKCEHFHGHHLSEVGVGQSDWTLLTVTAEAWAILPLRAMENFRGQLILIRPQALFMNLNSFLSESTSVTSAFTCPVLRPNTTSPTTQRHSMQDNMFRLKCTACTTVNTNNTITLLTPFGFHLSAARGPAYIQ